MALVLAAGLVAAATSCTTLSAPDVAADGPGELARLVSVERVVELCLLVADTEAARTRGLSSRDSLDPYDGMLFAFDRSGPYHFWMKDTTIPLDLVPIASDAVLGTPIPMTPCPGGTVCPDYGPGTSYDRALELRQGFLAGAGVDPAAATVTLELVGTACPGGG